MAGRDPLDLAKHVRHARTRHADVLHPHLAEAFERVVRGAAGLAKPVGLLRVRRADDVRRAGDAAGGLRAFELVGGGDAGQVGFDHQHRRGGPVETEVVHVVDGGDRELVEELEGDR